MIELGTSTHAIAGFGEPSKPFARAVAEIAECGYQHFMLLGSEDGPAVGLSGDASNALIDIPDSDLSAILKSAALHGLRVSCIYPGFGLDFSPEGVETTVERLRDYRELAWRLGCHVMAHSAGVAPQPGTPLQEKADEIQRVGQVMDAVASDRAGSIFKMAVDIHYGGIIETVRDCEYLLDITAKTNAGLCLNTGHMTTLNEEGWRLLEAHPERVHVLAWKDHLTGPDAPEAVYSVELGEGHTPFEKYVETLRKADCNPIHLITFEHVAFDEKKAALGRSREWLEALLREGVA